MFLIFGKFGLWILGGSSTSTIEYPRLSTVVVMKISMPYFFTLWQGKKMEKLMEISSRNY